MTSIWHKPVLAFFLLQILASCGDSGDQPAPPPPPLPHPEADLTSFNVQQVASQIDNDPQLLAWAQASMAIDQAYDVLSDTPTASLLSNPPDPQPALALTQARDAYRHAQSYNLPSLNIRSSCNGDPSEVTGTITLTDGVKLAFGSTNLVAQQIDGYNCNVWNGAVAQFISSRGVPMGAPNYDNDTGQTTIKYQGTFSDIATGDQMSIENLMIEIQRGPATQ